MKAPDELVKAFEEIGFDESDSMYEYVPRQGTLSGFRAITTTQQLQEWLFKEKNVLVETNHFPISDKWEIYSSISSLKEVLYFSELPFSTPSEALYDGLLKAVEIVKERNSK